MPAAITAKRRTNWIGPMSNVRSVPWPSISLDLKRRPRTGKIRMIVVVVLTGSPPKKRTLLFQEFAGLLAHRFFWWAGFVRNLFFRGDQPPLHRFRRELALIG